jgi:hypothetical protein
MLERGRLRYAEDVGCGNEDASYIGTMSTASMIPSMIDTYLEVKERAQIVLEHQVGNDVAHIYLQGIWENSSWHVFARIALQKLGERDVGVEFDSTPVGRIGTN